MKLEAITLREIQMPLVHFFETSFGRVYSRRILLLTAHCDGVDGWSECVAGEDPFYSSEWIETAWPVIQHYLAPAVLGRRSPAETAAFVEASRRLAPRDSVWSLDWNSGFRRTIAAENRNRTRLW